MVTPPRRVFHHDLMVVFPPIETETETKTELESTTYWPLLNLLFSSGGRGHSMYYYKCSGIVTAIAKRSNEIEHPFNPSIIRWDTRFPRDDYLSSPSDYQITQ